MNWGKTWRARILQKLNCEPHKRQDPAAPHKAQRYCSDTMVTADHAVTRTSTNFHKLREQTGNIYLLWNHFYTEIVICAQFVLNYLHLIQSRRQNHPIPRSQSQAFVSRESANERARCLLYCFPALPLATRL